MICYVDREEVPNVEEIDPAVLLYLIQKAEQAAGRYTRLDRYYRGEYPLLYPKPKAEEIQVSVNYAKYVVDIGLGYYLGEPVKYDSNPVQERELLPGLEDTPELTGGRRKIDLSPLLDSYDLQHISQVDLEIGRTLGVMGECLELCYASSDQLPRPKSAALIPAAGFWSVIPPWNTINSSPWCGSGGRPPNGSTTMPPPSTRTGPSRTIAVIL